MDAIILFGTWHSQSANTRSESLMRLDLFDLKLFVAVAEAGNLTQASVSLRIAPAAASARIKKLEGGFKTRLFFRESTGVKLTPAGQTALVHARRILLQAKRMSDDLVEYGRGLKGHVRIHAVSVAATEYLPQALSFFLASHPNVNVELEEHVAVDVIRSVREGAVDIGIIGGTQGTEDLQVFPYVDEQLVVVAPEAHVLARRKKVRFEEAIRHDFVGVNETNSLHVFLARICESLGHSFKTRALVRGQYEAGRMVAGGVGISIMEESPARRCAKELAIRIVPLADSWALRRLNVCVRDLAALPLFAQELVEILRAERSQR